MVINEELLSTMIEKYPGWNTGPEKFLGFITLISQLMAANVKRWGLDAIDAAAYGRELAALIIRELKVDISPYRDFEEVSFYCQLRESPLDKLDEVLGQMREEDGFFGLTEDAGILPSEATMNVAIFDDLFARAAVEKLRPYLTYI